MKDAYYFSHDSNARNDNKMLQLRCELGWEGYGLFFAVLELMRDEKNYMFPSNALATLQLSLSIDKILLDKFLTACFSIGLFTDDGSFVYSGSFIKRMKMMDDLRSKRSTAGKAGGKAKAKLKQKSSKGVASKGKERKVKEKKIKSEPPTLAMVKTYFSSNGYCASAGENAYHFYNENDWRDSNGKEVKNWKQKMRGVWFKNDNLAKNSDEYEDQFAGAI